MDTEQAPVEQEIEGPEAESEGEAIDGLEEHAAQHPDEHEGAEVEGEVPPVDGNALGKATEVGAQGGKPTVSDQALGAQAAPEAINVKEAAKRTKKFDKQEKKRAAETKFRTKKRSQGKDWTAGSFAALLKKEGAQGVLCELNKRKPAQGITVIKTAGAWDKLINALPAGKLGAGARHALDQMIADDVFAIDDACKLFFVRFNHKTEEVGGTWKSDTMKVMWRQLAILPANDVSKNTAITTFQAIAGTAAYGASWEAPDTINTVQIGEDLGGYAEHLEHTVRHEIAHGVHTQIPGVVNQWLKNDMQFWFNDDWDAWVHELGGYPAEFTAADGSKVPVNAAWKTYLLDLVKNFTGDGSWDPAKATPDAGEDANGQAAWAAMPPTVKNACAQSTSHWYKNYTGFQKVGSKHYFLNHWYHRPFTIGPTAFSAIASTNDNYTAMSEKEFFANCYAEYFANPQGAVDHNLWGGTLPGSIKDYFKTCIVARQPYDKFKKQEKKDKTK